MFWVPILCISYPMLTVGLPFLSGPRRPGAPLLSARLSGKDPRGCGRPSFPPSLPEGAALGPYLPRGGRIWPRFQARPGRLSCAQGHEAAIPLQMPLRGASSQGPEAHLLFSHLRHVWPSGASSRRAAQPLGQITNQKVR